MGGPEIDFFVQGDRTIVVGEAKWRSGEGSGQGLFLIAAAFSDVQTKASATLSQQSKLFDANQLTLREVERGLTPLGSHIAVIYELAIPAQNRLAEAIAASLPHLKDAQIARAGWSSAMRLSTSVVLRNI